ncbi:MAG: PD-(D/E)XK nuclease family protein, partial [Eubacteriales bacterium]
QKWMHLFSTRFSFVYPYAHLAGIPAKLTVSRLYPGILDEDGEGERTELSRAPQPVSMPEKNRAPRFLSGKTEFEASFAGTATHVFMQFCDFERLARDGAASELSRLRSAGFLTEAMADAVRLDEIERFRSSALLLRMRRAVRVRREFRFNAALPACGFTRDEALAEKLRETGTDVIVQGVVDCLFEEADGRVVLVDYKTDRLSAQEIREPALAAKKLCARHADQLRYYRAVCARMLARPVDECLIYSLPLGEALSVPAQELRAEQKSD